MKKTCTIILSCICCILAGAEEPSNSTALTPQTTYVEAAPEHGFTTAIFAATPEAQQAVLRGMAHLITFWDEAAYAEFKRAISLDPDCPMAHWGLVLSTITPNDERTPEKLASLKKLEEILAKKEAPEKELAYIRALFFLIKEGPRSAALKFEEISKQWRADEIAPLLTAMLCRDGFNEMGAPREGQQKAIALLDDMAAINENLQPAHFLRALLEETNPVVTLDTLTSALRAVELSPHNAPSLHLLGHLYFRAGEYEKAEKQFNRAAEQYIAWQQGSGLTLADNEGYFRATLYRAVSEWFRGDREKAETTAANLAKLPINMVRPKSKGTLIQLWEVRNLPLKMAVSTYPVTPKKEIEERMPPPVKSEESPLSNSVSSACLQYASLLLAQKDGNREAIDIHAGNLDRLGRMLLESENAAMQETSYSYWNRTMELCEQYLIAAKAMLYPDSADIWYNQARDAQQHASLLLPPVLLYPVKWREALDLYAKGDFEQCIKACDEALAFSPNHASVMETRQQAVDALSTLQQQDSNGNKKQKQPASEKP